MPGSFPLAELLGVLVRHGVEFVVVGGVAAVLNGAPAPDLSAEPRAQRASLGLPAAHAWREHAAA